MPVNRDHITAVLKEYSISENRINDAVSAMESVFGDDCAIVNFRGLKKGMTNRIFIFTCREKEYLMRIPGEGTETLLDRREEANVYQALSDSGITEKYIYLGPEDGIKIEEYIKGCHVCNTDDMAEVRACIEHLRSLHEMRLTCGSEFDLFDRIDFYEKACRHDPSLFLSDYSTIRADMESIKDTIAAMPKDHVLCHIDPVSDNFLITDERIYLIDWEYASMSDPHIDIAMFCIYAGYDRKRADEVIDMYFRGECPGTTRKKIYGYIAACGFLWALWCEIKRDSNVFFPEYEEEQYSYARDFFTWMNET